MLLKQLEEERATKILIANIYRALITCQALYRIFKQNLLFELHNDHKRLVL